VNEERTAPKPIADTLRRIRYTLAAVCLTAFIAVLVWLAQTVRAEPLKPLREVGHTAVLVCAIFALCLVSVAIFTRLRGEAERRQREPQP
jgi:hypothetical protein